MRVHRVDDILFRFSLLLASDEKAVSSSVVFLAVAVRTQPDLGTVVFKSHVTNVNMEHVKLDKLKSWARRWLTPNDAVRLALESQSDQVPAEEFLVLFKAWDLMMASR